jgi:hypothetical protein
VINDFEEQIQSHVKNHEFLNALEFVKKTLNFYIIDFGNDHINLLLDSLERSAQVIQEKLKELLVENKMELAISFDLLGEIHHSKYHHNNYQSYKNIVFSERNDSKDVESLLEEIEVLINYDPRTYK